MKKLISLVLVLALILSLSGCGISEDVQDLALSWIKDMVEGIFEDSTDDYNEPEETKAPVAEVIDLSQATKVEKFYEDYYVLSGVTREAAEGYVDQLIAAGYQRNEDPYTIEGVSEEHFMQELDYGDCYICFYKDTLAVGYDLDSYFRGDLWKLTGFPEDKIPEGDRMETPENTALPDWSGASPLTLGEYSCQVLTDVPYQQVENYALWMFCRNGREAFGGFDNHPIEDFLYIESLYPSDGEAYCDYQVVVWYDGTAILADIPGGAELDEYVFWTHLDARITLGESFLRKELLMVTTNVMGSGHGGFGTVMYSYAENCDAEDFERLKASVIKMGYVEDAEESAEGGGRRYFAMRKASCGGNWYKEVYYELILEADGYLEVEVSFYPEEGTHRD